MEMMRTGVTKVRKFSGHTRALYELITHWSFRQIFEDFFFQSTGPSGTEKNWYAVMKSLVLVSLAALVGKL